MGKVFIPTFTIDNVLMGVKGTKSAISWLSALCYRLEGENEESGRPNLSSYNSARRVHWYTDAVIKFAYHVSTSSNKGEAPVQPVFAAVGPGYAESAETSAFVG